MRLNIAEETARPEPQVHDDVQAAEPPPPDTLVTLRRTGLRPVSFRGVELCHDMSYRVGTPLWYEINVFHVVSGGYVVDIRMFTKSEGEQDKFTVQVVGSLEEAADFLEGYEPARDVAVDVNFDDPSKTLAELAFEALALRARTENARAQYQGLLSEIFAQLETARAQGAA